MPATPRKRNSIRTYSDAEKSSYVAEAVQLGNHKQYCRDKNIPYSTFRDWYSEYQSSTDKENWSPTSKKFFAHRVFTDSTEKAAVEGSLLREEYTIHW